MSVLIKGIELPKNHNHVTITIWPNGTASYALYDRGESLVDFRNVEVVSVPPHGRLGDLDKLEQMFVDIDNAPYSGFDGSEPFYSAEDAAQIIRLSPTVIEAEEPKEEE